MENMAFCVHGHFYQPPREDPLTGEIPIEPGAAPYRNWNERINARCYRPNAQMGNFEHISFNVGPTLLNWMEKNDPDTLRMIVDQERKTLDTYGVSNGMAQAYNHTILPLANLRDKFTQVRWGIADFIHRFGHQPQGMWLPETAADDETLWVLAECGIQFTILAPWQANADWFDPSHPYKVALPGGREIIVFFYDQDLSTRVSFDPAATVNADRFVLENVISKYRTHKGRVIDPQFIMVASDGELYGHHQPFRDKFLAYLMDGALRQQPLNITFPALWLREHPVEEYITIRQKSSWSCHHGVTRWMGVCDCAPDNAWKALMRQSFIHLAEAIDYEYEKTIRQFTGDAWGLRDGYIDVILGYTTLPELVSRYASRAVSDDSLRQISYLLRGQYERQRMFTSCGWFFDDFDRIEPRNNVAYAAQAIWLTENAIDSDARLIHLAQSELCTIRSQRTGMAADEVFRRHLYRAEKAWKETSRVA